MRDTELYHHLLGLQDPWFVSDVQINVNGQQVDVWLNTRKDFSGRAPSVEPRGRCTIMPKSACGGTWTVASFGHFCMPGRRGLFARNMACARCGLPGRSDVLASPFFLNGLPSKCCATPISRRAEVWHQLGRGLAPDGPIRETRAAIETEAHHCPTRSR